ncbi:hypothetical protein HD554DRAFT_2167511 [Boletus coccyginus]|nr:hypothetical protein HD554DRAFT_2167511 [Boletus coccyginus]
MSAGLQQLQFGQQGQSPQRNSGRAPLRRHSQILVNTAENDVALLEPSCAVMEDGENVTLRSGGARKKGKQTMLSGKDLATGGGALTATPSKRGGGAG